MQFDWTHAIKKQQSSERIAPCCQWETGCRVENRDWKMKIGQLLSLYGSNTSFLAWSKGRGYQERGIRYLLDWYREPTVFPVSLARGSLFELHLRSRLHFCCRLISSRFFYYLQHILEKKCFMQNFCNVRDDIGNFPHRSYCDRVFHRKYSCIYQWYLKEATCRLYASGHRLLLIDHVRFCNFLLERLWIYTNANSSNIPSSNSALMLGKSGIRILLLNFGANYWVAARFEAGRV